ncbi:MAG: TrkH family potassium uptake protein [Gammaproteobacteria bacterium]|nr:TrkH family potassium uptake protein [Gammaproteobacteria bacterium]MCY4211275.1 TrkH family potassium uptake protein [Gammaproteobacteria bacterium]MCY4282349.1 TrkH family potassium uptake protein [Gammaproteobacteria bacterium]MCY4337969.1 TrkH family potassium uptake protein [Gammaproteobacteria bacterium]
MQFLAIQKTLGLLLMLFSTTLLPPLALAIFYEEKTLKALLLCLFLILTVGAFLWLPVYKVKKELRLRDGFIVVVLFWAGLGLAGAMPFLLTGKPYISFTDSVFESVSGLTTTGATVLTGLDELPRSLLFYRQQLQWLGGMGIIVLAVAVLPMLGIGGMQLYRAETPGPIKDSKLTPRITETAKALWYIYLSLTIACAFMYWLAGMSLFDAVSHSFSTVSIGGFSTHDRSIGHFDSELINAVAVVFMLIAGINFTLHFMAWRSFSLATYRRDSEVKAFIGVLCGLCVITCVYLWAKATYADTLGTLSHGIFQSVSIATTTGFTTAAYQDWPTFLPVLLLFASFIGACAGSTGGGLKVIRIVLLYKQGRREIRRLIHPSAIFRIKLGGKPVDESVINAVWGFFASYVAVFALLLILLMATGLDQITAFSAVAACLNNLGPGLGEVSANYTGINDTAKWLLCLAMLLGRLEIFTLLVLLTPTFWRK